MLEGGKKLHCWWSRAGCAGKWGAQKGHHQIQGWGRMLPSPSPTPASTEGTLKMGCTLVSNTLQHTAAPRAFHPDMEHSPGQGDCPQPGLRTQSQGSTSPPQLLPAIRRTTSTSQKVSLKQQSTPKSQPPLLPELKEPAACCKELGVRLRAAPCFTFPRCFPSPSPGQGCFPAVWN